MRTSLKGRDLVSLHDLGSDEIASILDEADALKRRHRQRSEEPYLPLAGRNLAMIFQKPSLRTRVSFEAGMYRYGGHAVYLGPEDIQLGKRETTADIARTLSRYCDAIMARTFAHQHVVELAQHATVPVVNGLSDRLHPCQVLADLMTLRERKGRLAGIKLAFLGDGNNCAHSLLYGCAKTGVHLSLAVPEGYEPLADIVTEAREDARESGAELQVTHDRDHALDGADAIYTDVWASMGQESEKQVRAAAMRPYQLDAEALSKAKPDAIVLHCLPAHRGEEISDEVIEGPRSVVFDEAENRLHAQMALLISLIS
ncbi:MAG: ornithine carbamoyltransferase [Deltaproteobacteria bacterium]|nr:ornithine carbamoyltransferase [Deltaproteobacteria bacterium]